MSGIINGVASEYDMEKVQLDHIGQKFDDQHAVLNPLPNIMYDYLTYTNGINRAFKDGITEFSDWLIENNIIEENRMKELIRDFYGSHQPN